MSYKFYRRVAKVELVTALTVALLGTVGFLALVWCKWIRFVGGSGGLEWVAVAAASLALGAAVYLGVNSLLNQLIRRHLRRRLQTEGLPLPASSRSIALEDPRAAGDRKGAQEDRGCLWIHHEPSFVQIEGLMFRYFIWPEDVVGLTGETTREQEHVRIEFRIGELTLDIVLKVTEMPTRVRRQILGQSSGLLEQIRTCLTRGHGA